VSEKERTDLQKKKVGQGKKKRKIKVYTLKSYGRIGTLQSPESAPPKPYGGLAGLERKNPIIKRNVNFHTTSTGGGEL